MSFCVNIVMVFDGVGWTCLGPIGFDWCVLFNVGMSNGVSWIVAINDWCCPVTVNLDCICLVLVVVFGCCVSCC